MKICVFFAMSCFSLIVSASTFQEMENQYNKAVKISSVELFEGWYSGRCYTRAKPTIEKSGIVVFVPVVATGQGQLPLKVILPAASIGAGGPEYYDAADNETLDALKEVIFVDHNKNAFFQGDQLVSFLYYDRPDYPVTRLSLKQDGSDLILKMINADFNDEQAEPAHFYCRYSKKVSSWRD